MNMINQRSGTIAKLHSESMHTCLTRVSQSCVPPVVLHVKASTQGPKGASMRTSTATKADSVQAVSTGKQSVE